jgi:Gpi18-like mannosyltransferase
VSFYAEPLYLLLGLTSLYLSRSGRPVASGLAIGLAGAARAQAILLVIPLVVEFWQQHKAGPRDWRRLALAVSLTPIGSLAYMAWIPLHASPASSSSTYTSVLESGWSSFFTWPWVTLVDGFKAALFGTGIPPDWFSRVEAWHDLTYAVLILILGIWGFFKLRPSAAAFLLIGVIALFVSHGPNGYALVSVTRRLASLPPVYVALALLVLQTSRRQQLVALGASMLLLGVLSAWVASGRWVA